LLTSLSAAKEHLLLGDRVPSAEAHRLGLVNRVVPNKDTVAEALDLARRLAALPPHAAREARRLLNSHIERVAPLLSDCARAESECFETDEHRAALDRLSVRLAARPPGES
jgi:enoyl-CoA hydratase